MRRAGRWMVSCRSEYTASRYSAERAAAGSRDSRAALERVRGAPVVVDHGERVVHVAAAAAAQRRGALARGVRHVTRRARREQFLEEGRAFDREHGAGREIAEAQVLPAEEHEQQAHDVEHRHGVDDAEHVARDQRAGGGHLAFGREHAQAGHALARRAARHQRLEDQVIEEVDSRGGHGAGQVPQRFVVGPDVEAEVAEDQPRGEQQVDRPRARCGSASRAGTRGSARRARRARGGVDAGGARHARATGGAPSRADGRVHAAPRCSSSASCSAWCSCCSESSNSSILPCHDVAELVQREVDAVIGDAALRKVVRADALGAIARAHLQLAVPRDFAVALFLLGGEQLGLHERHGARAVLVLRAFVLALDHEAAWAGA